MSSVLKLDFSNPIQEAQMQIEILQKDYQAELQQCIQNGEMDALSAVSLRFQTRMTELTNELSASLQATAAEVKSFYPFSTYTELNLLPVIFARESSIYRELMSDPMFVEILKEVEHVSSADSKSFSSRKELLKSAIPAHKTLVPHLYLAFEECKKVLQLKPGVQFYIYNDPSLNAVCFPPTDGEFYIGFSSGLLQCLNQGELQKVIGHEIGHAILGHHRLPINKIMHYQQGRLSPLTVMKMFAWSKACEVSADRVGALCAPSFEVALTTLFKGSSGLSNLPMELDLNAYVDQYVNVSMENLKDEPNFEQWYSSHPFNPIRLKGLSVFSKSEFYTKFKFGEAPQNNWSSGDEETEALFKVFDPPYMRNDHPVAQNLKQFMLYAGLAIAAQDGEVDPSEVKAICDLTKEELSIEQIQSIVAMPILEKQAMLKTHAEEIAMRLSFPDCLNVIRDLLYVAAADKVIKQEELAVIYWCAAQLSVPEHFVEMIYSEIMMKSQV